ELAEKLWRGEVSTEQHHPFTPMFAIEDAADRVGFVSSFANVTVIDSDEGLLLVDTGGYPFGASVLGMVRTWTKRAVSTAVYTHGHVDHVFGIQAFDAEAEQAKRPRPRVIAHRDLPARFDRYKTTAGYNSCINARQFGTRIDWPVEYRYPDET